MAYVTVPSIPSANDKSVIGNATQKVSNVTADQAFAVVATHCAACHATAPTHAAFATAPAGVIFDSVKDIQRHKDGIYLQSVVSNIMPLGNSTGMTQDERDLLGLWISQGAKLK